MKQKLHVGLIGHRFMGRAHTHAYTDLPIFFETQAEVVKECICADEEDIGKVAGQWGFESFSRDWREVVSDPRIDIVDIAAPSALHADIAVAAARAGKHVFCEKPLALSLADAKRMVCAAKEAGVVNMIGFNLRKVPALAYAKKLIEEGRLGRIFHYRAIYQQDWLSDPDYPLVWRLQKAQAGYGTHGDMGAHVVDMARFLVGEIGQVFCEQRTFLRERHKVARSDGLKAVAAKEKGIVDVDDASIMVLRFSGSDAMGLIEVTRNGTGHKNENIIEVSGELGGLQFNMENMNELYYYDARLKDGTAGFRRIQMGDEAHPYMQNWWSAGHIIGYGDTFVNQLYDFVEAIAASRPASPDFEDGYRCQLALEAAQVSAGTGRFEPVEE